MAFVAGEPAGVAVGRVLESETGKRFVPAAVICELGYLAMERGGTRAVHAVLRDLETGALAFDCGDTDVARVRELVERYADLRLGVADAFVAACAERNGGRVLTLDRRHFDILGPELRLQVLP